MCLAHGWHRALPLDLSLRFWMLPCGSGLRAYRAVLELAGASFAVSATVAARQQARREGQRACSSRPCLLWLCIGFCSRHGFLGCQRDGGAFRNDPDFGAGAETELNDPVCNLCSHLDREGSVEEQAVVEVAASAWHSATTPQVWREQC